MRAELLPLYICWLLCCTIIRYEDIRYITWYVDSSSSTRTPRGTKFARRSVDLWVYRTLFWRMYVRQHGRIADVYELSMSHGWAHLIHVFAVPCFFARFARCACGPQSPCCTFVLFPRSRACVTLLAQVAIFFLTPLYSTRNTPYHLLLFNTMVLVARQTISGPLTMIYI